MLKQLRRDRKYINCKQNPKIPSEAYLLGYWATLPNDRNAESAVVKKLSNIGMRTYLPHNTVGESGAMPYEIRFRAITFHSLRIFKIPMFRHTMRYIAISH